MVITSLYSEAANAFKPDRGIFEYALQQNDAMASETIMIGDSYESDIVGARNTGIDQVYYNPASNGSGNKYSSTHTVKSLKEIKDIL